MELKLNISNIIDIISILNGFLFGLYYYIIIIKNISILFIDKINYIISILIIIYLIKEINISKKIVERYNYLYLPNSYYSKIINNPTLEDIQDAMNILDENIENMNSRQYLREINRLKKIYDGFKK